MDILLLSIPGLVAIVGNIIFYLIVKNKIDKSIEKHKISYAGIYQEKVKIHKELLKQMYELKLKIQQYQYSGDLEVGKDLFYDLNKFTSFYHQNQPFLRREILNELKHVTAELQGCFDNFYMLNSLLNDDKIDSEIRKGTFTKFFESGNKFKKNKPFQEIEEKLIKEMKKDLKIEE